MQSAPQPVAQHLPNVSAFNQPSEPSNSPYILNNKFEYFNNKPSNYYSISFHYYPENEVQRDQSLQSPYPTYGNCMNCTQLQIQVKIKPENLRWSRRLLTLFNYLS